MDGLQPLLALLRHAESARDAALAEARRADADWRAAQAQHAQLADYRRDYERRYTERFSAAAGIDQMRGYQAFMQRLSQAVDQQTMVVGHKERRTLQCRSTLQQHELQVASVRKLIERRHDEHQRALAQRERRQADEAGARAAAHRSPLLPSTP